MGLLREYMKYINFVNFFIANRSPRNNNDRLRSSTNYFLKNHIIPSHLWLATSKVCLVVVKHVTHVLRKLLQICIRATMKLQHYFRQIKRVTDHGIVILKSKQTTRITTDVSYMWLYNNSDSNGRLSMSTLVPGLTVNTPSSRKWLVTAKPHYLRWCWMLWTCTILFTNHAASAASDIKGQMTSSTSSLK